MEPPDLAGRGKLDPLAEGIDPRGDHDRTDFEAISGGRGSVPVHGGGLRIDAGEPRCGSVSG